MILLGVGRRGGAPHHVRRGRDAAPHHRRPHACGRHPAALGVLEDVPRDRAAGAAAGLRRPWRRARLIDGADDDASAQRSLQIIVADVSMSLDNVLAVAGAAKGEIWVLAVGLTVAVMPHGAAVGLYR